MQHNLKIQAGYLTHIQEGKKTFEVRFNDRDYQVGDQLLLEEYPKPERDCPNKGIYIITYVHHGLGMQEGYVILGIEK